MLYVCNEAIIKVNMISIVLLLPFFNHLYCMHCMYNVVVIIVVVEINFNSIQYIKQIIMSLVMCTRRHPTAHKCVPIRCINLALVVGNLIDAKRYNCKVGQSHECDVGQAHKCRPITGRCDLVLLRNCE